MDSIIILDNATQIALDSLWKDKVSEAILTSIKHEYHDYKYDTMEKGILSPSPSELPKPPPRWRV